MALLRRSISLSRSCSASSASLRGRRLPLSASCAFSSIFLSSVSISAAILALTSLIRSSMKARFRLDFRSLFSAIFWSFHSCGVNFSRKDLNFKHSSFCSRCLAISLWMALSWDLSCLMRCNLSCFFFVSSSASFMALCAFWSLFCKKLSKRVTSSSNICCDFFNASSFCLAFSSSFSISAFLTSRLICTRNISRFFATKSETFSFSRLGSRPTLSPRVLRPCFAVSAASAASSMSSSTRRFLCTLEDAVVFSQTRSVLTRSLSSARFCLSCSLMRKIWSSGGSRKGLS
mmetsp:Transcript_81072/g.143615  ORF Transcript_81072/g.143615 Transcript_81072/m.143615 type:complete len:289 (+) Transcript_81072:877-1743(+)